MEHVNHPTHYNRHPAGIECIEVIRHYVCDVANALKYLWRAGLKPEMGKEERDKEVEDLRKALWYVEDMMSKSVVAIIATHDEMERIIAVETGHTAQEITSGYSENVSEAINNLLRVGIIHEGKVYVGTFASGKLDIAKSTIQNRINEIIHTFNP